MKLLRIDEAAQRMGLSPKLLETLEDEGRIQASEKANGISYYTQSNLDQMIHNLLASIQRASWSEMEQRMEVVEQRLEDLTRTIKEVATGDCRML